MASDTLLVGVDSSPEARTVAGVAGWLGARLGLTPCLCHVVDDRLGLAHGNEFERDRRRQLALARAWALFDGLEAIVPSAGFRVLYGDPAESLCTEAAHIDAPLLAVGTRGRGRLERALAGSVSRAVASGSGRPVVVVPPAARVPTADERSTVVCALDGDDEDGLTVAVAADLAERTNLELLLVHVVAPGPTAALVPTAGVGAGVEQHASLMLRRRARGRSLLRRAERLAAQRCSAPIRTHVASGDPAEELERVAFEVGAQLLVTGTRGHGRVGAALSGSTAEQLTAQSARPVVVVAPGSQLLAAPRRTRTARVAAS